jgi:hypothetical protein
MSNALPFIGSATTLLGTAGNPATLQQADGGTLPITTDHNGGLLVREIGGKRFSGASRGNLFWANFGGAVGVSVIAAGQTTGVALLYNPVGSGILVELVKLRVSGATVETSVISGLALEGSVQTPTAVTAAASINAMPLGLTRGAPLAKAYQAATIVAMPFIGGLGLTVQATTSPPTPAEVDFDGTLVLAPGFTVNLVSAITQGTGKLIVDMLWQEWLP